MSDPDEPVAAADTKKPDKSVMAALRKLQRPASPAEVAEATGLDEKTVRRTLGRLVAVKDARRAGGDRFTASKYFR